MKRTSTLFPLLCVATFPLLSASVVSAQNGHESTRDVMPTSSHVLLLTPASPSVSQPIVIDRTSRADIMVTALAEDLDVTLISPKNARYSVGQARPDFESWISKDEDNEIIGANYRAILTDPTPGPWTLEVRARKLTADLDVIVNVMLDSKVFVSLVAGGIEHRVGSLAALSLAAFDGVTRIRGLEITAKLSEPSGLRPPVTFRDDGSEADITANDGIYTAIVRLPAEGEYQVVADVKGSASTGTFQRRVSESLRAEKTRATLGAGFLDMGVDEDADGFLDTITVAPAISVAEAGKYSITVRLRSGSGKIVQKSIVADLAAGNSNRAVRFHADDIRLGLLEDGPYAVEMVLLEFERPSDRLFVDERKEIGLTHAYRLQDLKHPRLRIPGAVTLTGVDTNSNGLFEKLKVEVDVETEVAGFYSCSTWLTDADRNRLGDSHVEQDLGIGRTRLTFLFDGVPIGKNGVNGPLTLGVTVYGPSSSLGGDAYFNTPAIIASQFEHFVPDATPPTIAVTVAPDILWPPDHKMVEIVPTISVQDDRDPSPSVSIESITIGEDGKELGDANTSPDIKVDGGRIWLRAERSGSDRDRFYTITWAARDAGGNVARQFAWVLVPHDRKK